MYRQKFLYEFLTNVVFLGGGGAIYLPVIFSYRLDIFKDCVRSVDKLEQDNWHSSPHRHPWSNSDQSSTILWLYFYLIRPEIALFRRQ